jgi:hypothetical protein
VPFVALLCHFPYKWVQRWPSVPTETGSCFLC